MAVLAGKLDPQDYSTVTRKWQLRDLLVWMERCRVQNAFDELQSD